MGRSRSRKSRTDDRKVHGAADADRSSRRLRLTGVAVLAIVVLAALTWFSGGIPGGMFGEGQDRRETLIEADGAQEAASFPEPAFAADATAEDICRQTTEVSEALVAAFPDGPDALHVKARWLYSLRDTSEAVKIWQECLRRAPDRADYPMGLAFVAEQKGDFVQAEALFRRVLELAPNDPQIPLRLAQSLLKQGKLQEVLDTLEPRVAGKTLTRAEADCLGHAYLQLGRWDKARDNFEKSVALAPNGKDAWYGLARCYARLGQGEKAREATERFRRLAEAQVDVSGQDHPVVDDLPLLRQAAAQTHCDAARIWRGHGRSDKAEELWRRAAALDPNDRQSRTELVLFYEQAGRDRDALRYCEQLRHLDPGNAERWLDVGMLQARLGRYEDALATVAKAVEMDPQNPRCRKAMELIEKGQ